MFVAGVEPSDGWPARPWDHRNIEDDGSIARVSVDLSGAVVLDADGDEVQSGPGFDHEVVKVRRGSPMPDAGTETVPSDRLTPDVLAIMQRAGRMGSVFGHSWVGTEHLGLALLEQSPARAVVGASWAVLAGAVAEFYEGPYAAARITLVAERLTAEWEPAPLPGEVPPVPNWSLTQLLRLSVDAATSAGHERADATLVTRELVAPTGWSLVRSLLGRRAG